MNNIIEYKGYHAKLDVNFDDNILVGTVIGVNDTLCFHATTVDEAKEVFANCIDEYLEMCKEFGREPDKEYKGSFNVRITPELHKKADLEARKRNISLNQFVMDSIENEISGQSVIKTEYVYCFPMEIMKKMAFKQSELNDYNTKTVSEMELSFNVGI